MIKAKSLKKTFKKGEHIVKVLDNACFEVEQGNFVMILGESGTGKTTLLNFIGALDRPDDGEIFVEGVGDILRISDKSLSLYRNRIVGHIFQTFNLKPTYTSYENVQVPLLFSRISKTEQNERIAEALNSVGLYDRRQYKPVELSEGQCQRVAIARAIVNRPKILLADEPTGNLDPKTAESIMNLLIRLNQNLKMTLLMVTHDLDVLKYAQKVFVLTDGKLNLNGDEYWRSKIRSFVSQRE